MSPLGELDATRDGKNVEMNPIGVIGCKPR